METKSENTLLALRDLKALETVLKTLEPLSSEERERVIRWAAEKVGVVPATLPANSTTRSVVSEKPPKSEFQQFPDAGEFLAAANPNTDADRVLCVATYLQSLSNSADSTLSGKQINDELKNLGHGVKNITDSINTLKSRKPQHMIQTKKSGRSKQSWKEYRVTRAGIEHANKLISQGGENGQNE
ncbi:MAG: hypothetical protein AB7F91_00585 [Parvularculaceae bacterium]